MNQNAQKLLSLPHVRHPHLTRFIHELASHPNVTIDECADLIEAAMTSLKLSELDIEMVQPEVTRAEFSVSRSDPQSERAEAIEGHVVQILAARSR